MTDLTVIFDDLLQVLDLVLCFKPIFAFGEGSDQGNGEFVVGYCFLNEYIWVKIDGFNLEALVPSHGNKIKLISLYFVPQKNNDLR